LAHRHVPGNSTNVRTIKAQLAPTVFAALERTAPGLAGWWADRLFFTPPRPALGHRLQAVLASGRPLDVRWGDAALPAWRWGHGPTVLLAHGWGSRGGHFAPFVAPLVEAGFSPVTFDAPAHGDAPGRRTNVPEMARALAAAAEAAGPLHGVVAHSVGAAVTALALRRGLEAPRIVFLAPAGDPEAFTRTFAGRLGLGPASLRAMRARAERRIGLRFADLDVRGLARGQTAALLVVHDREDEEIGWRDGAAVAEAWPGAELVTTSGLGHRRVLKDAGVVARTATFLKGREGRACGHHGGCAWDERAELCSSCALDQELFDRQGRMDRVAPGSFSYATLPPRMV
jgi:pimeloyl-ACP methyl ester carboxylesterase